MNLQKAILEWYYKHGRDFPWRHTKDPYKIMIAEFMLHRTKADQVVPVYLEFIEKYPEVYSLANEKEENIKKVTKHLGLHWRSKHFLKSANYIVEKLKGQYPEEYKELRNIPGIGEYIAGAIVTVCFNKPAPVVDSNIARFLNRFYGLKLTGEIRRKKEIVRMAADFFDYQSPSELLFAILDFTSLICKPVNPDCKYCPLRQHCDFK